MRHPIATSSHLTTAGALVAELHARGFADGPPARLSPEVLAIDRRCAQTMHCICGRRGMTFRAYHRASSYEALACCPRCGHAEPV